MPAVTIDTSTLIPWLRENWGAVSTLVLAVAAAFFPGSAPEVQAVLQLVAAVLGAGAVSLMTARHAVRSEARKLGLLPPK